MKGPSSKKKIITDDAEFFQTQQGFFFFLRIRIGDSCVQKATHFIQKKKTTHEIPKKGARPGPTKSLMYRPNI
jgi:hypothetical protein